MQSMKLYNKYPYWLVKFLTFYTIFDVFPINPIHKPTIYTSKSAYISIFLFFHYEFCLNVILKSLISDLPFILLTTNRK